MELSLGFAEGLDPNGFCCTPGWAWGPADTATAAGIATGIGFYLLALKMMGRGILAGRS